MVVQEAKTLSYVCVGVVWVSVGEFEFGLRSP